MKRKGLFYVLIASLIFSVFPAAGGAAEKYPAREIQFVSPNQPGGFVDITVRLLKPNLEKILGVPIVVDSRPAGKGTAGTVYVMKAKPDGYTIGTISSATIPVLPAITPNVPFKYSDLDPLAKYAISPTLFFCRADAPWKTIEDLVADAKKRPGQITYGTTVSGTSELLIKGFIRDAGINMLQVPMEAAGQTIIRTVGGNLDLGVTALTTLTSQIKAGTVRVLFLSTPERVGTFPQIPTMKEKGYGGSVVNLYNGFFAPRGVPQPIRETLVKALEKAIKDPAVKKKLEELGTVVDYLPADAFTREIEEDYNRVLKITHSHKH